jgi:hypothetical protein
MLPVAEDRPSRGFQLTHGVKVALLVRGDLVSPKFCMRLRRDKVCGAPVPEAAIDEDNESCAGERYVGSPAPVDHEWSVNEIPKSSSVEKLANSNLRLGVLATVGSHRVPCGRRRSPRHCVAAAPMRVHLVGVARCHWLTVTSPTAGCRHRGRPRL